MDQQDYIQYLENRITILEQENIETTNTLYEIENRLQAQIDALINYTMELKDWAQPNDVF
jgi:hypothetical protein